MPQDPFNYFLDIIPLWGFFFITVAIITAAIEAGFRIGTARRDRSTREKDACVGTVVSSTLALVGFMLAMTFGVAVARFDARRQAFLREVNALGTAYLRADLLPELQRFEASKRLREYVDTRLSVVDAQTLIKGIRRSEELHEELWRIAVEAGRMTTNPVIVSLFIQALNEVIDLHAERIVAAFKSRIPAAVWLVLYLVALAGMAGIGYQTALVGSTRSPTVTVLVLSFASLLWLVASLDRPMEGPLRLSQQAMRDLQTTMHPSP